MDTKQNNNNTGDSNTGSYNSGNYNSGFCNTGIFNIGDCNTGNANRGDCNSGSFNIGDYNSASYAFGCFNTQSVPEPKIFLFNKPSNWTLWDWLHSAACEFLSELTTLLTVWMDEEDMSYEEKEERPEYKTQGGYLKTRSREEQITLTIAKWKELSDERKREILSIPNFDKAIFKQITGIDVDND